MIIYECQVLISQNLYWGDTRLHSYRSGDAYLVRATITPEQVECFAKVQSFERTAGKTVAALVVWTQSTQIGRVKGYQPKVISRARVSL